MTHESETRECPYCKEEVKRGAVRCRHCLATISAEDPGHGGICPFCKENISAEALRCPRCAADLVAPPPQIRAAGQLGARARKTMSRRPDPSRGVLFRSDNCEGCAPTDTDSDGEWTLLECSEHFCIYELTTPNPYGVFR